MNSHIFKVLIPTSGIGTPLGEITNYTNKSLIKVGKKPTLSYILEAYPKDTEFIITIGHYGQHVKDFIKLVYPQLRVTFVEVDRYYGEKSSLAYSLLKAATYLQSPFIYHASDTIVLQPIAFRPENWIAGFPSTASSHYTSFDVINGKVQYIYDKGQINPDFLHIGIVGIYDYEAFWSHLRNLHAKSPLDQTLGDVQAINSMLKAGLNFSVNQVNNWYDVGNVDSLIRVRREIPDSFHILDKLEESIFVFDDQFVIKFFHNPDKISQRVQRVQHLKGLVPEIQGVAPNFYRYKYTHGKLYSKAANAHNFREFLSWANQNLWNPVQEVDLNKFRSICNAFYRDKTRERIQQFLQNSGVHDEETIINDEKIPAIKNLLQEIDFNWLCDTEQTTFHGDFILDNILKTESGFCLLDWRQNFGGLLQAGDRYYDFSKLNHNLTINHGIINDNLFTIQVHGCEVECDVLRKQNLIDCQEILFQFLEDHGYDTQKVRLLTALIWLNMSPLHHHPFDLFLFYFGKLHLWKALQH